MFLLFLVGAFPCFEQERNRDPSRGPVVWGFLHGKCQVRPCLTAKEKLQKCCGGSFPSWAPSSALRLADRAHILFHLPFPDCGRYLRLVFATGTLALGINMPFLGQFERFGLCR